MLVRFLPNRAGQGGAGGTPPKNPGAAGPVRAGTLADWLTANDLEGSDSEDASYRCVRGANPFRVWDSGFKEVEFRICAPARATQRVSLLTGYHGVRGCAWCRNLRGRAPVSATGLDLCSWGCFGVCGRKGLPVNESWFVTTAGTAGMKGARRGLALLAMMMRPAVGTATTAATAATRRPPAAAQGAGAVMTGTPPRTARPPEIAGAAAAGPSYPCS